MQAQGPGIGIGVGIGIGIGIGIGACGSPRLQGVPNFRDLGGIANALGRPVRRGLVYRSELLTALSAEDRATLTGLGIVSVFDLRNPSERAAAPAAWPGPADRVTVHVMTEELQVAGADMRQLVQRIRDATLQVSEANATMLTSYRVMPAHFGAMLGRLFEALDRPDDRGAALVHCTAGKDRTGFVCAMLLLALDVPMKHVVHDYLSTAHFYSVERLIVQMERVVGQSLNPGLLSAVAELAQVKAAYLDAALNQVTREHASVDAYLRDRAGLDDGRRARLQARLLE